MNEEYYWSVSLMDDTSHVSFTKSGLTWNEAAEFCRKFSGEVTSFRMDREGRIDG